MVKSQVRIWIHSVGGCLEHHCLLGLGCMMFVADFSLGPYNSTPIRVLWSSSKCPCVAGMEELVNMEKVGRIYLFFVWTGTALQDGKQTACHRCDPWTTLKSLTLAFGASRCVVVPDGLIIRMPHSAAIRMNAGRGARCLPKRWRERLRIRHCNLQAR